MDSTDSVMIFLNHVLVYQLLTVDIRVIKTVKRDQVTGLLMLLLVLVLAVIMVIVLQQQLLWLRRILCVLLIAI